MVVVMDCTRDVAAVEAFMRYSVRFGLICVLLYILVLSFLCNFAIQPFVENMENQKRFITNAGHELKNPPLPLFLPMQRPWNCSTGKASGRTTS